MDWEQEEREWKEIAEHFKNLPATSSNMFKYEVITKHINQEQTIPFYKKDWFKIIAGVLSTFVSLVLLFCDFYIVKNYVNPDGNFIWSFSNTLMMVTCVFFAMMFLLSVLISLFYSLSIFLKYNLKDI